MAVPEVTTNDIVEATTHHYSIIHHGFRKALQAIAGPAAGYMVRWGYPKTSRPAAARAIGDAEHYLHMGRFSHCILGALGDYTRDADAADNRADHESTSYGGDLGGGESPALSLTSSGIDHTSCRGDLGFVHDSSPTGAGLAGGAIDPRDVNNIDDGRGILSWLSDADDLAWGDVAPLHCAHRH